ncbi:hypothetical protein PFWH6_3087 [Pseudomonas fluorescens WH6]|nr:hypothetical protein PFWH6_3087 [Pseudomonas fluorescens WH6]
MLQETGTGRHSLLLLVDGPGTKHAACHDGARVQVSGFLQRRGS